MNEKNNIEYNKNEFEFFTELNKKKDIIIPELTFKNIQTEMLLFKNEILKDINQLTKDLREKHKKYDFKFKDEIKKINKLLEKEENNIHNLSELISVDKETKRKLENLLEFEKKVEEYMMTNDIRMTNFEKDVGDNIFRHDSIFKDTVIYPGTIGPMCKFKNFHELIDYFINQIYGMLRYKEKNEMDLSTYKNKLETMINGFKLQFDNFMKSSTEFTRKVVNQAENRINNLFLKYDDLINVNRIQCCKNNTNLENIINKYKETNEENIKKINEDNEKLQNMLKEQKEEIKTIQEKIYDINKKTRLEYSGNYYNNNRFNKMSNKNINQKNGIKLIKSASNAYQKEDKIKKNNSLKDKEKDKDNSEVKKTITNNETSDSRNTTQINNDIKNLEIKLQNFIKTEIINLSKNINNVKKKLKIEKPKEKIENITTVKNISKEEISKSSEKQLIIKTDIEQEKKNKNIFVPVNSPKRNSSIQINFQSNIFEQIMKKREDKKNSINSRNRYIFEKIKEVFIEESSDKIENEQNIIKIDNIQKRKSFPVHKIPKIFYETVIKKETTQKKSSNSTKNLPFFSKIKRKKEKKSEKSIKYDINTNKKIIKNPLKNKLIKKTETFQKTDEKNLTQKINKPKISLNYIEQNINNILEYKIRPYSKNKNQNKKKALTLEAKKPKNKIEIKEDIFKTPKIERNQHLSNFTITLKGAKKLNIEQLENLVNDSPKNTNLHSPTIYTNFPRAQFKFNEKIMESLHPLYRNKKFSKYIRPYISALTNNYQTMLTHNEKKTMSQKKVVLYGNKSETNLIKNNIFKLKNEKEIKLPEIIDEEVEKNQKYYSPGYREREKFNTLEEKDGISLSSSNRNLIQDVYLNKDNRFNLINVNKGARFINLKKKI